MEDGDILQPGVNIKPVISFDEIKDLIFNLYGFKVAEITELNGYDDKNYHVIVENDKEKCADVGNVSDEGYVFKIVNSLDSKKDRVFEAQNALLLHLARKDIMCPQPVPTKEGLYFTKARLVSGIHIVRLLIYVSGSILDKVPCTPNLFFQAGEYVAKLDQALQDFRHPAYTTYKSLWMLESLPKLHQFIFAVKDESKQKLVVEVINEFQTRVIPLIDKLERGLIHGDFNEQNIIVEKREEKWEIKAILDFGDTHVTCYVFELAVTMAYMILQSKDIDTGGYVIAGYSSVRQLPDTEYQLLKICIAARLCQSLVMGAYSHSTNPENSYVLTTSAYGWTVLEQLWREPEQNLLEKWKNISKYSNT